jgi:hypothetical protein
MFFALQRIQMSDSLKGENKFLHLGGCSSWSPGQKKNRQSGKSGGFNFNEKGTG